jgi:hypothetical protein
MVLFVLMMIFAGVAQAQCPHSMPAIQSQMNQLQTETRTIFRKLSSGVPSTPVPIVAAELPKPDLRIVPGTRAGDFDVGSTFKSIGTKLRLSQVKTRSEARYEFILPLGYVPERSFSESFAEKLTFAAATADGAVLEIFVRNPKYTTENGVAVGSPVSAIEREGKVTSKKVGELTYYQGDGITFIADRREVKEIVVIRKITPKR